MGKKRSNRNKKKKNSQNGLQNSIDEKPGIPSSAEGLRRANVSNKNNSFMEKALADSDLPNKSSAPSFKTAVSNFKSNTSISQPSGYRKVTSEECEYIASEIVKPKSEENRLHNTHASGITSVICDTEICKLSDETCNGACKKTKKENQNSSGFHDIKPVTLSPSKPVLNVFPVKYKQNICLQSERDEAYSAPHLVGKLQEKREMKSKSNFHVSPQNTYKKHTEYERLYYEDKSSESDEEGSTSNFFQPVFEDCYARKNNAYFEENFYGATYKSTNCAKNASFPKSRASGIINAEEKYDIESNKSKEAICNSVDAYKDSKYSFTDAYDAWLPERRNTLQKLRELYSEVRTNQLNYNKSQESLRKLGLSSRSVKNQENQLFSLFASLTAFMSDAASGVVSVAQAFNVESYQNKFQEIMENDAKITQNLYKARSLCVAKYQNIEEVMRKFHFDTFSSTVGKISNTLEVNKYWEAMKNAYQKDDMTQLLDVVGQFFDNASVFKIRGG